MQLGSLLRSSRRRGPDIWEFRYRDRRHNGRRIYRRITVGTVRQFRTEASARKGIAGLIREINLGDPRLRATTMTVAELVEHYQQRELMPDNTWKSYSTKRGYESYLKNWIVPHWGNYKLPEVKTIEVETWLRNLSLAKSSCAKIRNIFSVLFNHACRYDLFDRNPITLVRHSAKRRRIPDVPTVEETQRLLLALSIKERTMVFLAVGTGLRRSELFALKWKDVDFAAKHLSVTRSIVSQAVGVCKTEASQKPVPLHESLAEVLLEWRRHTSFRKREDWVFASPHSNGKRPYWAQAIMRYHVAPVSRRIQLQKRVGWHTFRHTYATMLKQVGADIKVMQELLRHSSVRCTLDTYTQAIMPAKRAAQSAVLSMILAEEQSKPSQTCTVLHP
jgi:integrase